MGSNPITAVFILINFNKNEKIIDNNSSNKNENFMDKIIEKIIDNDNYNNNYLKYLHNNTYKFMDNIDNAKILNNNNENNNKNIKEDL